MIYFYISLVTYICYCLIKYRESFYYLEQEKYDNKKYGKRLKKDFKQLFITPELLFIILIIIALSFNVKVLGISTIILYMLLFLYKLKTNNKDIKITKKTIVRTIIILIIYLLLNIWFCIDYASYHGTGLIFESTPLYYIILYIMTYLSYLVLYIVNIIAKPIDKLTK